MWNLSQAIAEKVYRVTRAFPVHEQFGLTAQMRRAIVSVSANVAEGSGRLGDREMVRFLRIARGSAAELDSRIDLAKRLDYLNSDDTDDLSRDAIRLQRMLFGLIRAVTTRSTGNPHCP